MHCPFCSSTSSFVKDSRCSDVVRRRRFCIKCGEKFTTLERIVFPKLQVLKNSKTVEFDQSILCTSIKKSFSQNSVELESKVDSIVDLVVKDLHLLHLRKVYSYQIVDSVIKILISVDKVAAIRFAFFYKEFSSAQDLLNFIQGIESE
jgi:transcriptional repressor NrdR